VDNEISSRQFVYLTTTGRKTGLPREIEIWFVEADGSLFILAEHGSRPPPAAFSFCFVCHYLGVD